MARNRLKKSFRLRHRRPIILTNLGRIWVIFGLLLAVFSYVGWQAYQLYGPPDIHIISPAQNTTTVRDSYVQLKGSVGPNISLSVNGSNILMDEDNNFDEKVALKVGLNRLEIRAVNRMGRTKDILRVVEYGPQ